MTAKICKEKQISFGNNMKYSDFIDGKYFCDISALKDPTFQRKPRLVNAREISEKSLEQKSVTKSRSNFTCEIVLAMKLLRNFKIKLL